MQPTLRDPNPPLTRSVKDYLKAIYHLSSQGGFAATSDIAAMLEVAPPSVSGMVKRLSETGLIEHVPYRGVQLTSQGRRAALRMIRRHRILELYLTQHLGYDWGSVHAEAERLEHAVSDELIERMASALGQPQYDPHGDPIPTAAGDIEEAERVALADARVGTKLELRQVGTQDAARLRYFAEQGLTPGVLLTVSDRQPFNGPTTIALCPPGTRARWGGSWRSSCGARRSAREGAVVDLSRRPAAGRVNAVGRPGAGRSALHLRQQLPDGRSLQSGTRCRAAQQRVPAVPRCGLVGLHLHPGMAAVRPDPSAELHRADPANAKRLVGRDGHRRRGDELPLPARRG